MSGTVCVPAPRYRFARVSCPRLRLGVPGTVLPTQSVLPVRCPRCRNENFAKGSVESTHKVPTSHYHTKHFACEHTVGKLCTFMLLCLLVDVSAGAFSQWRTAVS